MTQAQASLNQNEVNLEHTVIEAPIDGLVISRNVDVGQTVAASMQAPTLFVLAADLTKMQVVANLDESDVGRIRPGQRVRSGSTPIRPTSSSAPVAQVRLQPTIVQNVVTYATVIDVPNPELKLKPGMTANVNIEIARRTDVLRVPNAALRFRPTNEMFAALGQTPPPAGGGRGGGRGRRTRNAATAQAHRHHWRSSQPTPQRPPCRQQRGRCPAANQTARRTAPAAQAQACLTAADAAQLRAAAAGEGAGSTAGATRRQRRPGAERLGRARTAALVERGGGRGNFQERMAAMSPEERQQFMERMRARGLPLPRRPRQPARRRRLAAARAPSGVSGRRTEPAAPASRRSHEPAGATTIDALFGALAADESSARSGYFRTAS